MFLIAFSFVFFYSILPHKELRFLFPVLPLWNISAATALVHLFGIGMSPTNPNQKQLIASKPVKEGDLENLLTCASIVVRAATVLALLAGSCVTILSLGASRLNYPGGVAMHEMHAIGAGRAKEALANGTCLKVHVGVFPAMTGVSRFSEKGPPWRYSKQEDVDAAWLLENEFDYLLSANATVEGFYLVKSVEGFSGLQLLSRSPLRLLKELARGVLPIELNTAPQVYIQERAS